MKALNESMGVWFLGCTVQVAFSPSSISASSNVSTFKSMSTVSTGLVQDYIYNYLGLFRALPHLGWNHFHLIFPVSRRLSHHVCLPSHSEAHYRHKKSQSVYVFSCEQGDQGYSCSNEATSSSQNDRNLLNWWCYFVYVLFRFSRLFFRGTA